MVYRVAVLDDEAAEFKPVSQKDVERVMEKAIKKLSHKYICVI